MFWTLVTGQMVACPKKIAENSKKYFSTKQMSVLYRYHKFSHHEGDENFVAKS